MTSFVRGEPVELDYFAVVGVGRSGTSLLMTMLDSHPGLAMPPETQFVYRHVLLAPHASLAEARERLASEVNFKRLGFDLDEFLSPFESGAVPYSNASAYLRLLTMWAERTGRRHIGDKSPKNIECLPILARLTPQARLIHIVRDPRDVFLSRTKAAWCSGRSPWLQTLAYRAQLDTARELGPRLFGDRYLEVHYEQLVREPAAALRQVCDLLGVAYHPKMLDRDGSASTHVFPEEIEWKREVLGPLLRSNTEKWRNELSPDMIAFIEDCCVTSFGHEGYVAQHDSPGRGGVRGRVTRHVMATMSRLYRERLAYQNRRAIRAIPQEIATLKAAA